jgi:hypothetical protein
MSQLLRLTIVTCVAGLACPAAELQPRTNAAFDEYVRRAEARIDKEISTGSGFILVTTPEARQQLRAKELISEPRTDSGESKVPHGLINDWIGATFIPGVSVDQVLAMVQDYEHHKVVYQPEVVGSKVISHNGNDYRVYLRLVKHKVITVVLNTEHQVHYERLSPTRWRSKSVSVRIAEVASPGSPDEKEVPSGHDHGFMWRLNSYWTFQQADGGTYVECEAISLSRDIPTGLGWLISPIIRELPRQSLAATLAATRKRMLSGGESQQPSTK